MAVCNPASKHSMQLMPSVVVMPCQHWVAVIPNSMQLSLTEDVLNAYCKTAHRCKSWRSCCSIPEDVSLTCGTDHGPQPIQLGLSRCQLVLQAVTFEYSKHVTRCM
jgi:hypothetical protein